MKISFVMAAAVLATGCAQLPYGADPYQVPPIRQQLDTPGAVRECAHLLRNLDRRIDQSGVRDVQSPRIAGYPYLRVDRLALALVSPTRTSPTLTSPATATSDHTAAWIERAAALDVQARSAEVAALGSTVDGAALEHCRTVLLADAYATSTSPAPAAVAQVPDNYDAALRAVGLYPLTRLAFYAGIRRWHGEVRQTFATPLEALAPLDPPIPRVHYAPGAPALNEAPAGWIAPATAQALGLPAPSITEAWQLLQRHAPRLALAHASADDALGTLQWQGTADEAAPEQVRMGVDTQRPTAYARIGYTLMAGQAHLQLIYTYWFPARTATGAFDLLAGALDGLIWRVTLDRQAQQPLVYDTIHPCGCFHLFFPTARVRVRPAPTDQGVFDEGLFAPQIAPPLAQDERLQLLVAAGTHYVQRLVAVHDGGSAHPYTLVSEERLRALPLPTTDHTTGHRSAYSGAEGLIAGSQRGERFFFWPMGIASAGQMRQWGRHATAFVGRRHFDDPTLMERYFVVVE